MSHVRVISTSQKGAKMQAKVVNVGKEITLDITEARFVLNLIATAKSQYIKQTGKDKDPDRINDLFALINNCYKLEEYLLEEIYTTKEI